MRHVYNQAGERKNRQVRGKKKQRVHLSGPAALQEVVWPSQPVYAPRRSYSSVQSDQCSECSECGVMSDLVLFFFGVTSVQSDVDGCELRLQKFRLHSSGAAA